MTTIQIISNFYKNMIIPRYKSLLSILGLWALSHIALSIPLWIYTKQPVDKAIEMLLSASTERLVNGVSFLNTFTPDELKFLVFLIISSLIIWIILSSYFESVLILHIGSNVDFPKSIKQGWHYMPKLIGARLLLAAILIACIIVGFTVGLIVFPIAGLFVLLSVVVLIYFYVRLSFMTFEIIIQSTSLTGSLSESMQKTSKYSWGIFFIFVLIALCSSALNNLTGNALIVGDVFSTVFQVATVILILPLFLEAIRDAREDQQSNINA